MEKIKFYAKLERPFLCSPSDLSVHIIPKGFMVWDPKLQDKVDIYISISSFAVRFPKEWQHITSEWESQCEDGIPIDEIVAEVELPTSIVEEFDVELIPLSESEKEDAYHRLVAMWENGCFETDDGVMELDSSESPFRRLGLM